MGYNSAIFICNDAMPEVDEDPEGWWSEAKLHLQMLKPGTTREFGFGSHANGFRAVHNHHADNVSLIALGGNYASVLWNGHRGSEGHHTPEQKLALLREAASALGYALVPARPAPIRPYKPLTAQEEKSWEADHIRALEEELRVLRNTW